MNVKLKPEKYLKYLVPLNLFGTHRTREILQQNPTISQNREEAKEVIITVHDYNNELIRVREMKSVEDCFDFYKFLIF